MSDREEARKRTQMLKRLREMHAGTVEHTQALYKEQNELRKRIRQALKDGAKTVPDLAQTTQIPADQVLWHITAMKKYNLVAEVGMNGDYYQYQLIQEGK
jgi:predicted transcriptional regulator